MQESFYRRYKNCIYYVEENLNVINAGKLEGNVLPDTSIPAFL